MTKQFEPLLNARARLLNYFAGKNVTIENENLSIDAKLVDFTLSRKGKNHSPEVLIALKDGIKVLVRQWRVIKTKKRVL